MGVAFLFWGVGRSFGRDAAPPPILWACITGIAIGALIILRGLLPLAPNTAVPIASALVAPIALALPLLLVLPFGSTLAVYSFLLDVSAEPTPPGAWTVHQYEPVRTDDRDGGLAAPPLAHSGVYDHPEVLKDLTAWLKERAAV